MEGLEFENIFDILGIKSLNIQYIKEKLQMQTKIMISNIKRKGNIEAVELERLKKQYETLKNQAEQENKSIDEVRREKVKEKSGRKYQDVTPENIEKYEKLVKNNNIASKLNDLQKDVEELMKSDDLYLVLYYFSKIKLQNLRGAIAPSRNDTVERSEEKRKKEKLYDYISDIFSSPEDIKKYINYNMQILSYVDVDKADMSYCRYIPRKSISEGRSNIPDYVYEVKLLQDPEQLLLKMPKKYSEDLKVYKFGQFSFGRLLNDQGQPTSVAGGYDIIGVSRKNDVGETDYYHGVMEFNPNFSPQVFHDVVFTDVVMKNAMSNNFGYIGTLRRVNRVIKDYSEGLNSPALKSEQVDMLCFDAIGSKDLVTALSFAMNHDGMISNKELKNLAEIYRYIDESLILKDKIPEDVGGDER